jgi:hypothetical protein
MTIIASGDIIIVDIFYTVRDASGFWKDVDATDDTRRVMTCIGDPLLAKRFYSAEDALVYLKEESELANGKANVVKIEVTTKIGDVRCQQDRCLK